MERLSRVEINPKVKGLRSVNPAEVSTTNNKQPTITLSDVSIIPPSVKKGIMKQMIVDAELVPDEQKEVLVVRCPDNKPSSFRFSYNDKTVTEDSRHFHHILRKHNADPKVEDYENKEVLLESMKKLRGIRWEKKHRGLIKTNEDEPEDENFEVCRFNDRNIADILYEDHNASQVKVVSKHPFKLHWTTNGQQFCQHEEVPESRLRKLQARGIDINTLKRTNIEEYYDQFTRCYDVARFEHEGKHYCKSHYKRWKYGRTRYEDMMDGP